MRRLVALLGIITLATASPNRASAQVANGGFESGDFTGWTQFGDVFFSGVDNFSPHTGTFSAYFGNFNPGGIFQNVATVPGASYTFSYWLRNEPGDPINSFSASWNGIPVASNTNQPGFPYSLQSFTVTATGASTPIRFEFTNPSSFFDLDDVAVTNITPEPASMTLLATGLVAMMGVARRRRKQQLR